MKHIQYLFKTISVLISLILLVGFIQSCSKKNLDIDDQTQINAPTGLSASSSGYNITLQWNSVSNAYQYRVYYSESSSSGPYSYVDETTQTSIELTAYSSGTFYFVVTAVNNRNYESSYSSPAYCTIQNGGGGGGSTQISAPTGLYASASGNNVSLSWNSVSGAYQYNVYYSQSSGGSWKSLTTTSNTSTTQTISGTGTYYFAVTAVDRNWNESAYSSSASCTIQGGGQTPTKPSTPSGLTAYWDGPASYPYVVLQWNSVNTATSYLIYRATSANGSYSKIGDSSYNSYSDNNVSIGKTYYYKIKASNSAGTSDYSSYTSVTLEDKRAPGPVTYGSCTATSTSITLRWTIPTDASYGKPTKIILRLYEPTTGQWVDAQTLSGTATSVTFSFGMWLDSDGYVRCGVIPYNDYGSGGGYAKVYDYKNKKWIN